MIINCHKINLSIFLKKLGTQTIYFETILHVAIAFKVDYSPKVI
jgi:hypothetical protein